MARGPTTGERICLYVAALVVLPLVAYGLGTGHAVQTECGGDGGAAECDLPGIAGLVWGVTAFLGTVGLVVMVELALASSRRHRT